MEMTGILLLICKVTTLKKQHLTSHIQTESPTSTISPINQKQHVEPTSSHLYELFLAK